MSWMDRLFRRTRQKLTMEDDWEGDTASYSSTAFASLVTHGYRKNELIFACISKAANTASQVGLKFYRKDVELDPYPAKQLIQQPNPFMSEFDFWAANIIYQKLAGIAYWEKERTKGGQVIALWPLRPDWITPIQLKNTAGLAGYEFRPGGGMKKETLPAEDVVAFPLWDPLGLFETWPPVAVAARVGDVDNATTDYIKMFMQKGGTPPGILKTKQRIANEERVEEIRARWRKRYGGTSNWLDPAVLDEDADYQQIGSSFKDMGFSDLDARSEARICMVLDVPPILIGAKVGLDRATYSNYGEARRAWWEDSLVPMYANLEDVIINQVLTEFEPGITCEWDFSRVSALQEDRNSRWQRATVAWNAGAITMNEFRAEAGLPERPDGDVFKQEPAPIEILGTEEETESEPEEDEPEEPKAFKAKGPPDDDIRRRYERNIKRGMEEFFSGQLSRIERTLKQKVLVDMKTLVDMNAEFWEDEDDELFKVLFPLIMASTMKAAELAALELLKLVSIGIDWALVNQEALTWARTYSYSLVSGINHTTRDILQKQVGGWIEDGLPLDNLITALASTFGPARAEMIGVTETTRAFAEGNIIAWRESGVVDGKRWFTAEDELVCEFCGPLDGMVVDLDGGEYTTEEGGEGPTAPPLHVNCRCWLGPVVN